MDEVEEKAIDIQDSVNRELEDVESLIEFFLDNRDYSGLLDD